MTLTTLFCTVCPDSFICTEIFSPRRLFSLDKRLLGRDELWSLHHFLSVRGRWAIIHLLLLIPHNSSSLVHREEFHFFSWPFPLFLMTSHKVNFMTFARKDKFLEDSQLYRMPAFLKKMLSVSLTIDIYWIQGICELFLISFIRFQFVEWHFY